MIISLIPVKVTGNTELPDPTRPANYQIDKDEPVFVEELQLELEQEIIWQVSAIRISEDDRNAIVNGKLVRVGDILIPDHSADDDVFSVVKAIVNEKVLRTGKSNHPATIIEINPKSVIIDYKERKLIVSLFKNQVTKDYRQPK